MSITSLIKLGIAVFTLGIGAYAFFLPKAAARFTGLSGSADSPRGMSEVRAVLGGAFIGAGLLPFLYGNTGAVGLGIIYLAIGITRTLSIARLDQDRSPSSLISVGSEYLFAALLILLPW